MIQVETTPAPELTRVRPEPELSLDSGLCSVRGESRTQLINTGLKSLFNINI